MYYSQSYVPPTGGCYPSTSAATTVSTPATSSASTPLPAPPASATSAAHPAQQAHPGNGSAPHQPSAPSDMVSAPQPQPSYYAHPTMSTAMQPHHPHMVVHHPSAASPTVTYATTAPSHPSYHHPSAELQAGRPVSVHYHQQAHHPSSSSQIVDASRPPQYYPGHGAYHPSHHHAGPAPMPMPMHHVSSGGPPHILHASHPVYQGHPGSAAAVASAGPVQQHPHAHQAIHATVQHSTPVHHLAGAPGAAGTPMPHPHHMHEQAAHQASHPHHPTAAVAMHPPAATAHIAYAAAPQHAMSQHPYAHHPQAHVADAAAAAHEAAIRHHHFQTQMAHVVHPSHMHPHHRPQHIVGAAPHGDLHLHHTLIDPATASRPAFYAALKSFRESIGAPIQRLPTLGFKELDLWVLYTEVIKRGGIDTIIAKKQWKEVAEALQLPSSCTDSGFRLRLHYKKYLEAYERRFFRPPPSDVLPTSAPPSSVPSGVNRNSSRRGGSTGGSSAAPSSSAHGNGKTSNADHVSEADRDVAKPKKPVSASDPTSGPSHPVIDKRPNPSKTAAEAGDASTAPGLTDSPRRSPTATTSEHVGEVVSPLLTDEGPSGESKKSRAAPDGSDSGVKKRARSATAKDSHGATHRSSADSRARSSHRHDTAHSATESATSTKSDSSAASSLLVSLRGDSRSRRKNGSTASSASAVKSTVTATASAEEDCRDSRKRRSSCDRTDDAGEYRSKPRRRSSVNQHEGTRSDASNGRGTDLPTSPASTSSDCGDRRPAMSTSAQGTAKSTAGASESANARAPEARRVTPSGGANARSDRSPENASGSQASTSCEALDARVPISAKCGESVDGTLNGAAVDFSLLGRESLVKYCEVHGLNDPSLQLGSLNKDKLISLVTSHFNGDQAVPTDDTVANFIGAVRKTR